MHPPTREAQARPSHAAVNRRASNPATEQVGSRRCPRQVSAWAQVGPAVLQVAHQLLDLKRRAGAPRSLLSAMLERSLVKLLKLLRELLTVHPWSAPPLRAEDLGLSLL